MTIGHEGRRASLLRFSLASALAVGLQAAVAFSLPRPSPVQTHTPVPELLAVELVAPPAVIDTLKPAATSVATKRDPAPHKIPTATRPKTPVAKPDLPPSQPPKQALSSAERVPPVPDRSPPGNREKAPQDAASRPQSRPAEAVPRGSSAVVEARPDYLSNPPPDYPAQAQRQGWTGTVVLRVRVDADGHARDVRLVTSAGRRILDDAARKAVLGWRFAPARRNGAPVASWVDVPIRFELTS